MKTPSSGADSREPAPGANLPAFELAKVPPGTYGPVSISLDSGTLSVWAVPLGRERIWHSRSLDRDGQATTPSHVIGKTSLELGLVTLAPVNQGLRSLLTYSTQSVDQSTKLFAIALDTSGQAKSAPTELVTLGSPLLWTQIVDTASGPIVLYAVTRDDTADLRAVGLTPDAGVRFADREVLTGLRAWQTLGAPDGAALAVVRSTQRGRGGVVSFALMDGKGVLVKGPTPLDAGSSAESDLDLTRVGNNYVLAWSDRGHIDSRVFLAALDPAGNVITPPTKALPSLGEQSLVRIVPPAKGGRAVLVWENANLPSERRRLSLTEIDSLGKVSGRTVHLVSSSRSSALPEFLATEAGLRVLTLDDYGESDTVPTYLEFGPELTPLAAVPLTLQAKQNQATTPLLAWGLDCRHGCRATAALDDSPVTIATIPLENVERRPGAAERARRFVQLDAPTLPKLTSYESIFEIEPLADLSAARQGNDFQIATLTYFDPSTPLKRLATPGPDGRTDPWQARVDVRRLSNTGDVSHVQTISYRATSLPGLSIATGGAGVPSTSLVWSALDQGQPQLFVTALGDDTKKRVQRMITHKKGRLDDVNVAPVADGWLLTWFDERTGETELYAAHVNAAFERRGAEQRLTSRLGELTAQVVVPMTNDAIAIYVASRRTGSHRTVELLTRRIGTSDGQPLEAEHRVLELPGSVKFLSASRYGDGIAVGWLEVPADSALGDAASRLRYMTLDARGQASSPANALTVNHAVPASFALDCGSGRCHAVVISDVGGRGELDATVFDPTQAQVAALVPLARSIGTVEQNVSPVLLGEHVFTVDQVDAEHAHVVHAQLQWE
jgi:hypothetical protein